MCNSCTSRSSAVDLTPVIYGQNLLIILSFAEGWRPSITLVSCGPVDVESSCVAVAQSRALVRSHYPSQLLGALVSPTMKKLASEFSA